MFEVATMISALAAVGALVVSVVNAVKIKRVHVSINSRMDQLLSERGIAERALGLQEGRDEKGRDQ
jgi:hypothetical protein